MARALVTVPSTVRRGEPVMVRAIIAHPMETGFRPGADGRLLPRDIVRRFSARYNGELVFGADLFSAVSANPFLEFHARLEESGTLVCSWEGDNGFAQSESVSIAVT